MLAMAEELGHVNSMLSMAEGEGLGGHGSLSWDDDSWAFPILESEANDGLKMSAGIGDSDRRRKGEEVEVAPPPTAAAPKGKKRKAGAAAAGGGGRENERNGCGGGENEGNGGGGCCKASGGKNDGGDGGGEGKEGGGCGGEHEQHIWIERERRKKMRDMFTSLHSLIPHLPPKADKSTIVDEAVQYIQKLEQTLESLEKQKTQMLKGKTSLTNTTCDAIPSTITQNKKQLPFQSREAFLAEQGSAGKPSSSHVALANPNPLFPGVPAISKTWTSPNVTLNVYGEDAHINVCCPKKPGLLTGVCFVLEKYRIEVVSAQVSADRERCMCMIHVRATGPVVQFQGSLFLVEEIFKQAAMEIMVWVQKPYVFKDYIN